MASTTCARLPSKASAIRRESTAMRAQLVIAGESDIDIDSTFSVLHSIDEKRRPGRLDDPRAHSRRSGRARVAAPPTPTRQSYSSILSCLEKDSDWF